jgi:hypothetical protein
MTPAVWQIGDEIGLPTEPGVGSVLRCLGGFGAFTIGRDAGGWFLGSGGSGRRFSWRAACISYGPWAGDEYTPFVVIHVPDVDQL